MVQKVYKSSQHQKILFLIMNLERSQYSNIKLQFSNNNPKLVINYSNNTQQYSNEPKLIMAHKMYGFLIMIFQEFMNNFKR